MGFDERVDVVDLILKVLKEHEKNLDSIILQLNESLSTRNVDGQVLVTPGLKYRVQLSNWEEFKERSLKAEIVAYDISDSKLSISAYKNGSLTIYTEEIPEFTLKKEKSGERIVGKHDLTKVDGSLIVGGWLKCGLSVKVKQGKTDLKYTEKLRKISCEINTNEIQSWLSSELKIDKKSVVSGKIEF
jgi:hypothetical protein